MGVNAVYQVAPICQFLHLCFPPHTLFAVLSSLLSTQYQQIHFQMSVFFFNWYSLELSRKKIKTILITSHKHILLEGFLHCSMVKNLPAMQEMWVWSLSQEDPLEEGMATHSSVFAWRIPRTEEPGGLQSMGSHRVGHNGAVHNTVTSEGPAGLRWRTLLAWRQES